jgi:hypothetical protein
MAVLTANPIYKIYQSDAVNNIQETPGASSVLPADGSINTATPGKTPGITTMKVTDGQPSGSNLGTRILDDPTIQQATSTFGANPALVFNGLQCDGTLDSNGNKVGAKSGANSLQNDTSAMAQATAGGTYPASVPAIATGVGRAAGLTQSPENQ